MKASVPNAMARIITRIIKNTTAMKHCFFLSNTVFITAGNRRRSLPGVVGGSRRKRASVDLNDNLSSVLPDNSCNAVAEKTNQDVVTTHAVGQSLSHDGVPITHHLQHYLPQNLVLFDSKTHHKQTFF